MQPEAQLPVIALMRFDDKSKEDVIAEMRGIMANVLPKDAEAVKQGAAALKSLGAEAEPVFRDWSALYGRWKAKQLFKKVRPDPDALEELFDRQTAAEEQQSRFVPLDRDAIQKMQPPRDRVKDVLPIEGLAAIYGKSGSAKGFLVEDMGYAIAEGRPWFGHRTKQGPVLHVVLEGASAVPARVRAWEAHNGRPFPPNFRIVTQPFVLTSEQDVQQLAAICPPGCTIFIDTLNRATPRLDENSGKDMGVIIAAASRMQRLVGGLVILVSHTGKDAEKGLRGHSSLFAALDGAIAVSRTEVGRSIKIDKVKDGADCSEFEFQLEVVTIGKDHDGDTITSSVVVAKINDTLPKSKAAISPRIEYRFAM
ncbi:AAA family ATPase [Pararhodobacter aggregans]